MHAVAAVSQVEQDLDQVETPQGGDLHDLQVKIIVVDQDQNGGTKL